VSGRLRRRPVARSIVQRIGARASRRHRALGRGRRLDHVYPRYRVRRGRVVRRRLDRRASRSRPRCIPAGAAAPWGGAQGPRPQGRGHSRDFRLARDAYGAIPAPTGPGVACMARLWAHGAPPRSPRRTDWWPRRAANPPAAVLALAPLRELMRDAVVDASRGVSGAGRGAEDTTHFVSQTDVNAYKVEATGTALSSSRAGRRQAHHFTPHIRCRLDMGSSPAVRDAAGRSWRAAARNPSGLFTDGRPLSELAEGSRGVRDVRDTQSCRIHADRWSQQTGRL